MNELLLLYSHCILVKGVGRSSICDLQRNKVHLIPNSFANLFEDMRYLNVLEVQKELDLESEKIWQEYLFFLCDNELAFYCRKKDLGLFPIMSEEWLFPSHISNCVLDTYNVLEYFDEGFLGQLEDLYCNFLQFRFFSTVSFEYLNHILCLVDSSQIKSVEVILPEQDDLDFYANLTSLVSVNKKISNITVFGSDKSCFFKEGSLGMGFILRHKGIIEGSSHCGIIHESLFSINISTYTESLSHNTCLNRKVSIDPNGEIRNCPSMIESFGNINDITLREAIEKPGYKDKWSITKDEIKVCKDCEFRHVCTDCRAYVDDPADNYSKPLKCGYNPYICMWEEWSTNPLKQKAIKNYGLSNLKQRV